MGKIRDSGILAAYCALLFLVSAQSKLPTAEWFSYQDKAIHVLAYAVMAFLAWRAFGHFIQKGSLLALCSLGFSGFYGLSDEVHQYFVPGRCADLFDLIADMMGAAIAVMCFYFTSLRTVQHDHDRSLEPAFDYEKPSDAAIRRPRSGSYEHSCHR
ncbi:MAG: VanZ family protein [Methylococcales bacterium]